MSWSFDGRKMSLVYPGGVITYVRVTEKDARNIGVFMIGFGVFLVTLSIVSIGEIVEHGRFINIPFARGVEALTAPVIFLISVSFLFTPRAAIALLIMAAGFLLAVDLGREAMTLDQFSVPLLALGVWHAALLVSFVISLWPYPMWPGVILAYLFGSLAPVLLLAGTITPGGDIVLVLGTSIIALCITLFGIFLRSLFSLQQEFESANYIRYGD